LGKKKNKGGKKFFFFCSKKKNIFNSPLLNLEILTKAFFLERTTKRAKKPVLGYFWKKNKLK